MASSPRFGRPVSLLRNFLRDSSNGGKVLIAVAAVALAAANSPWSDRYVAVFEAKLLGLSVAHWINDALMSLFFLLVGLEIKREMLNGQLASWPRRMLPILAAAGGMAVPALVYLAFAAGKDIAVRGWAIPSATDIAFALGVLALLRDRVPVSLVLFLTAIAIIDDLGAVVIIALFYTAKLDLPSLAGAAATFAALWALNIGRVRRILPYLVLGGVLWFFVHRSGVHATVAGVLLASTIPLQRSPGSPDDATSLLHRIEHALQPWVAFAIVPVFAFANAGVSFGGGSEVFRNPVTLGVAFGLFAGKQIGVLAASWGAVRLGWAARPSRATWLQVYGVALLCGIGFTMSLFIAFLAFPDPHLLASAKSGILLGSFFSATAGATVLWWAGKRGFVATRS